MEKPGQYHVKPRTQVMMEIPNYEQLVFHPIPRTPEIQRKQNSSDEVSHQISLLNIKEDIDLSPFVNLPTEYNSSHNTQVDAELSGLVYDDNNEEESDSQFTSSGSVIRCAAPTPITMMKGKPDNEASSPRVSVPQTNKDSSNTLNKQTNISTTCREEKKKTVTIASSSSSSSYSLEAPRRREPPPRPEGLPLLNLENLPRQGSGDTMVPLSPRLLSPRVKKPTIPMLDTAALKCPDQSKALPSLQSPRSAFSARELVIQRI